MDSSSRVSAENITSPVLAQCLILFKVNIQHSSYAYMYNLLPFTVLDMMTLTENYKLPFKQDAERLQRH